MFSIERSSDALFRNERSATSEMQIIWAGNVHGQNIEHWNVPGRNIAAVLLVVGVRGQSLQGSGEVLRSQIRHKPGPVFQAESNLGQELSTLYG